MDWHLGGDSIREDSNPREFFPSISNFKVILPSLPCLLSSHDYLRATDEKVKEKRIKPFLRGILSPSPFFFRGTKALHP